MSTATPPSASPSTQAQEGRREILIVSHSTLYYWWPVWAIGFILGIVSLATGGLVVIAPGDVILLPKASGTVESVTKKGNVEEKLTENIKDRDVLVPKQPDNPKHMPGALILTPVHVSRYKDLGVFFTFILLLVIFITNVPLRGLWSVIIIIFLVALVIILGLLGILESIVQVLTFLDIRISASGYFVIAGTLFTLWLIVFFFFDRQIYMVFTPGQLRVKLEIGDAETAYDTTGMTIQKQRSDLFRHWILGLGSGDLIVRTAGAQGHQFDMPNVLFLGRKVREIEDMLRSRQVVSGQNM